MNYITDIKALEGKTISKANFVDCQEAVSFIFTDGSFAHFDLQFYGESYDVYLASGSEIDDYTKVNSGFMSQEELDEKIARENKKIKTEEEVRERRLLEELKLKYENIKTGETK